METDSRVPADGSLATERTLAQLWSEVLAGTIPGADDNFFALGGDSMGMVLVEYRINEELRVELPAGAMLGAPTLRELAVLVDEMNGSGQASPPGSEHHG